MKKFIVTAALAASIAMSAFAEKQTVKLHVPSMECNNCKGKIENVLAYEKGVRKLDFDLATKTVTITFEDKRTSVEKLQNALIKYLNFKSEEVKDCCKKENCEEEKSSCCEK